MVGDGHRARVVTGADQALAQPDDEGHNFDLLDRAAGTRRRTQVRRGVFLATTADKTSSVNSLTEDDSLVLKVDAAA